MNSTMEKDVLENIKAKLDALIDRGDKLSKDLSAAEKKEIIKKVVNDCIEQAIENTLESEEISDAKIFSDTIEKLKEFVTEYMEKRLD